MDSFFWITGSASHDGQHHLLLHSYLRIATKDSLVLIKEKIQIIPEVITNQTFWLRT